MADENNPLDPNQQAGDGQTPPPAFGQPASPTPPPAAEPTPENPAAEPQPTENFAEPAPTAEPTAETVEQPANPNPPLVDPSPVVEPESHDEHFENPTPPLENPSATVEPEVVEPIPAVEPVAETPVEPQPEAEAEITEQPTVEPVVETPVEPQNFEAPAVETEPIVEPQPIVEPTAAETAGEVIAGAPTRPGDKIDEAPAAENPTPPPPAAGTEKPEDDPHPPADKKPDGSPLEPEEKVFSAIGYISWLALLPFLARRDSDFCQHHGRQGLILTIFFTLLFILAKFSWTLGVLTAILQIAAIVFGFLLAYKGDWFRIPGVYQLSLFLKFPAKKTSDETPQN